VLLDTLGLTPSFFGHTAIRSIGPSIKDVESLPMDWLDALMWRKQAALNFYCPTTTWTLTTGVKECHILPSTARVIVFKPGRTLKQPPPKSITVSVNSHLFLHFWLFFGSLWYSDEGQ
jgi:hypothetical protein